VLRGELSTRVPADGRTQYAGRDFYYLSSVARSRIIFDSEQNNSNECSYGSYAV
jgi:hypothetical protein